MSEETKNELLDWITKCSTEIALKNEEFIKNFISTLPSNELQSFGNNYYQIKNKEGLVTEIKKLHSVPQSNSILEWKVNEKDPYKCKFYASHQNIVYYIRCYINALSTITFCELNIKGKYSSFKLQSVSLEEAEEICYNHAKSFEKVLTVK
jgi:hypothetical protein